MLIFYSLLDLVSVCPPHVITCLFWRINVEEFVAALRREALVDCRVLLTITLVAQKNAVNSTSIMSVEGSKKLLQRKLGERVSKQSGWLQRTTPMNTASMWHCPDCILIASRLVEQHRTVGQLTSSEKRFWSLNFFHYIYIYKSLHTNINM